MTKWVEAYAVCDQTSETIAALLIDNIVCKHGVPVKLISDRGANFLSSLMMDICQLTGIKKLNITAYHPRSNGLVENFCSSYGCQTCSDPWTQLGYLFATSTTGL